MSLRKFSTYSVFTLVMILTMVIANISPVLAQSTSEANDNSHRVFLPILVNNGESTAVQSAANVTVGNGHLVFPNMDEFQVFMEDATNRNDNDLDAIESDLGFTSMRSAAQDSTEPDEAPDFIVEDLNFATALNPDGLIQIGEHMYKVTESHVYRTAIQNHDALAQANDSVMAAGKINGVDAFAVIRSIQQFGDNCYDTSGNYRLKGRSWVSNYFFYASAGTYSKFEKKKKFLWWTTWKNHNASTLSVVYESNVLLNGIPATPSSNSITQNNTSKVSKTIAWGVGVYPYVTGEVSANHTANHSGNNFFCSTDDSW